MDTAPPPYSEIYLSPPAFSVHNYQNHGYDQEEDLNVAQGYNLGQDYQVGQVYNTDQGYVGQGYNVDLGYNVNQGYYTGQGHNLDQGYNVGQRHNVYLDCNVDQQTYYENYRSRHSINLGIGKMIVGVLCIICNAVLLCISGYWSFAFVGHGIWGGVLLIVAGTFGVKAGRKKARSFIVWYIRWCILGAMAAEVIFNMAIYGLAHGSSSYTYNYYNTSYGFNYSYRVYPDNYDGAMAMNGLLLCLSVIAVVMSVWGITLGRRVGLHCCSRSHVECGAHSRRVQVIPANTNNTNLDIMCIDQPNPAPPYIPYPGYSMQPIVSPPAYQPYIHSSAIQINEGFSDQSERKRQFDDRPPQDFA